MRSLPSIMVQKIHFIAIGGSAMHNLALALHQKGYQVSGSDDEINEPSKSRLAEKGLLPAEIGWFPEKITPDIHAVILGMHAREDNPELIRAKELNLNIYSYPEYLYEATKNKTRIVVGGSHGKTSITAMILHAFKHAGLNTDYMVGAQLKGFDTMVKLSNSASYVVLEGDEYLSSPIDRRPKFHLYKPHIAIISGIAWDHINVFPTFEIYLEQFARFIELIEENGTLIYCQNDVDLNKLVTTKEFKNNLSKIPYAIPEHVIENGVTSLIFQNRTYPLEIFGAHNLMNLNAAMLACEKAGISKEKFLESMQSFSGAAKRLELVYKNRHFNFYKDFAHSPSKLKATTSSVKTQFPNRKLIACMELHTFSSLNENFLNEYNGAMDTADEAIVYFNRHTVELKKLKGITEEQIKNAFARGDLKVFTNSNELGKFLKSLSMQNAVLLMMSSGTFDGIKMEQLATELRIEEA